MIPAGQCAHQRALQGLPAPWAGGQARQPWAPRRGSQVPDASRDPSLQQRAGGCLTTRPSIGHSLLTFE